MHVSNSLGYKENKSARGLNKPWKFDNISETQFLEEADTGDILLFVTKGAKAAELTRKLTASKFDHVAMILKFDDDDSETYYVDSTSDRGVSI